MEIETYRYLLSALIQVFGALIAVDVIFLVVKYQDVRFRLPSIVLQMGRFVEMAKRERLMLPGDYDGAIDHAAQRFQLMNKEEQSKAVSEGKKQIMEKLETIKNDIRELEQEPNKIMPRIMSEEGNLAKLKSLDNRFDTERAGYELALKSLNNLPLLVGKVMSLPAVVMIVLSLALIFSDKTPPEWLFIWSMCLIVAAGASLVVLIDWAKGSFIE